MMLSIFCSKNVSKLFIFVVLFVFAYSPIASAAYQVIDPPEDDQCSKLLVVFARGSGQNGTKLRDSTNITLKNIFTTAGVSESENQTATFIQEFNKAVPKGVKYVSLHNFTGRYNNYGYVATPAFDAVNVPDNGYQKPPTHRKDVANRYYESVKDGAEELAWYLEDQLTSCPLQQVVLGGYSQGAQVVGEGLSILKPAFRSRIAFTALYGDPKYNSVASFVPYKIGDWVRGNTVNSITHGILDARRPYPPEGVINFRSWCAAGDAICDAGVLNTNDVYRIVTKGFGFSNQKHSNIYQEQWIPQSINEIVGSLKGRLQNLTTNTSVYVNKNDKLWNLDLAVVIDRTSSMQSALGQIKGNATGLTTGLLGSYWNSRVGVVTYGGLPYGHDDTTYEYSSVVTPFTNDETAVREGLKSISAQQPSYGLLPDGTPYLLQDQAAQYDGIMTAIQKLNWEHGAQKKIIVITNNRVQSPDPSPNHWTTDQVRKAAFDLDPAGLNLANVSCDETWNCDYSIDEAFQQLATQSGGQIADVNLSFGTIDDLGTLLESMQTQPVPKLSGDQSGSVNAPVFLNGSESYDPNGAIAAYAWDCTSDGTWGAYTLWPTSTCTYDTPGDYLVTLRTDSDDQQSALAVWPVHISAGSAPNTPSVPEAPQAKLQYRTDGQLLSWGKEYGPNTYIKISDADDNLMGYAPADAPGVVLHLPGEMTELHVRASGGDSTTWSEPAVVALDSSRLDEAFSPDNAENVEAFTVLSQPSPSSSASENSAPQNPPTTAASDVTSTTPATVSSVTKPPVAELLHQTTATQLADNLATVVFTESGSATNTSGDASHVLGSVTQQNTPATAARNRPSSFGIYAVLLTLLLTVGTGWGIWRYAGRKEN